MVRSRVTHRGLDMNRNATADVVFLLDVDNTLLDNDRIIADLRGHLEAGFGVASAARYALDPVNASLYPAADITVEHIGDLLGVDDSAWLDWTVSPANTAGRAQSGSP